MFWDYCFVYLIFIFIFLIVAFLLWCSFGVFVWLGVFSQKNSTAYKIFQNVCSCSKSIAKPEIHGH